MTIRSYLWLAPFIFFIGGYFVAHRLFRPETFATPSVIGKPLDQALVLLSDKGLGARIIAHKKVADLPEGIVITQSPADGQAIKTYQTVSLVVSQQPSLKNSPSFVGMTQSAIDEVAKQATITVTYVYAHSSHPTDTCYAQKPSAGQPLVSPHVLVYCSSGSKKPVLWPSFTGKPLGEAISFLAQHNITPHVTSASTKKESGEFDETAPVIDQYPRPGALVTLSTKKPLPVVLQIP